ncbi:MAG: ATP-dependent helicase RecG, partial [Bacteroidota bacterium]|nr:ATP-dependent helicase RecG [Bacteroidota bacterium]
MNAIELIDIIGAGETSKVQFKRELDNRDNVAAELIAFSNSKGGMLLFGVEDKTGEFVGLEYDAIQRTSNTVSNIANEFVKPTVYITTEVVTVDVSDEDKKSILVVHVDEGVSKPYKDRNGAIWIKQGSDKRRVTDNNEQIRLFQQSGSLYVDEMIIPNTSEADVDKTKVEKYIKLIQKADSEEKIEIDEKLLTSLNIMKDNKLTLAGLEFFANNPQKYRPAFCVKAISFFGNSISESSYRDSKDIEGTIPEMFDQTMAFLSANLRSVQAGQNFNSIGVQEISKIALEELIQNAFTHRDYSKNSPIRIMIFDDRVEIVIQVHCQTV